MSQQQAPLFDPKDLFCTYPGCKKVYNRRGKLNDHIRSHTNERPFACPYPSCTKDFRRDTHLKHHIKSAHTGVRDHACDYPGCGKSFATGQRLRRHLAAHVNNDRYKCKVANCGQIYKKQATLDRHVIADHQSGPYICDEEGSDGAPCGKTMKSATALKNHKVERHGPKYPNPNDVRKCEEPGCGLIFDKMTKYNLHTSRVHGEKLPWVCRKSDLSKLRDKYRQNWSGDDACGRGYKERLGLEEHVLTFHLGRLHPRVNPNVKHRRVKNRVSNLGGLAGTYDEENGRTVPCANAYCGLFFSSKDDLQAHVQAQHSQAKRDSNRPFGPPEATRAPNVNVGTLSQDQALGGHVSGGIEQTLDAEAATGGQFWISAAPPQAQEAANWDYFLDIDRAPKAANDEAAARGGGRRGHGGRHETVTGDEHWDDSGLLERGLLQDEQGLLLDEQEGHYGHDEPVTHDGYGYQGPDALTDYSHHSHHVHEGPDRQMSYWDNERHAQSGYEYQDPTALDEYAYGGSLSHASYERNESNPFTGPEYGYQGPNALSHSTYCKPWDSPGYGKGGQDGKDEKEGHDDPALK